MQLATADSPFPLLAAFGTVTWGEREGAKTRVRGINLAGGAGAWAIGFQAWEGTLEKSAATTNSWWDASSFGFTGREHDLDASLVYARARYLNPGTGGWTQPDPYGESITRNGGIGAEPMVRSLGTGLAFPSPQAPRYAYAEGRPSVFADPSGLMVVYVGVGATASTFAGGTTFGVGMAIGTGTGFSYVPIAFTAGFAVQAYQLINISASVDFSVFWGLEPDEACSIRGPFLTVSMDPGLGFSVSMVWSISWPSLQSFLKTGYMPDLSAALGAPVGLTISPGILPTKWGLPAGGVTIFGTWTWIPYAIGCSACGQ